MAIAVLLVGVSIVSAGIIEDELGSLNLVGLRDDVAITRI